MYKVVRIVIGKGDQKVIHEHSSHYDFHVAKRECLKETNKFKQHSFAAFKSGRVSFDIISEEELYEIFTPDSRKSLSRGVEIARSYGRQGTGIAAGLVGGGLMGGVVGGVVGGAIAGPPGAGAGAIALGTGMGVGFAKEFSSIEIDDRKRKRKHWAMDDHITKKYGVDGLRGLIKKDQREIAARHPVGSKVIIDNGNDFPSKISATVMGWDHSSEHALSVKADGDDVTHTGLHPHRILNNGSKYFEHHGGYLHYNHLKPEVLT